MSVRVRFPALFADRIGGVSTVEVPATTVDGALRAVTERYGELRALILAANGAINPVMMVFLNDEQLQPDQLALPIQPGDEIEIVPAIEGG
jgi:molybdopterin converting factor small subunit